MSSRNGISVRDFALNALFKYKDVTANTLFRFPTKDEYLDFFRELEANYKKSKVIPETAFFEVDWYYDCEPGLVKIRDLTNDKDY